MADVADEVDKKAGEGEDEGPKDMKFYLMPANTYVIIEKEWKFFVPVTAITYCLHLFWMCYGVDVYSSYERHVKCGDAADESKTTLDGASAVYDTWILLCIIFHMVEWIR